MSNLNRDIELCAGLVPTTWLDPLLTGPNAVIGKPPYNCHDIERLLGAVAERIRAQARPAGVAPSRRPLTLDRIDELWEGLEHKAPVYLARAVEREHGIGVMAVHAPASETMRLADEYASICNGLGNASGAGRVDLVPDLMRRKGAARAALKHRLGLTVDRTALWDAIAELVVACGGSAADFDEGIANRIDAAARGVPGTFEGGGGQGKDKP